VGDPPADQLIAELFDKHGHEGIRELMAELVATEWVGDSQGAQDAEAFIVSQRSEADAAGLTPDPAAFDATARAGQAVFAEHGLEIMMILGCYSLPAAYAAANGVHVLRQTDYLTKQPNRRLVETAQIIVDVMQPGGLHPEGIGTRSAEKTRLMHAAIRHLILHRPDHDWDADSLGTPINQEDMAATLMTFCYIVIDGLDKMGVTTTPEEKESYLAAWREVGRIMGVVPELLPDTFLRAEQLTRAIQADQVLGEDVPPDDPRWRNGREMTTPLLRTLNSKMLPGVPGGLMRLFLPRHVADGLGVPNRPINDWAVKTIVRGLGWFDRRIYERFGRRSWLLQRASMRFMNMLLTWQRGGDRQPFRIPDSLDWYERYGSRSRPASGSRRY
jgi:hypothetical protein